MQGSFRGVLSLVSLLVALITPIARAADDGFVPLFPDDGIPKGWSVRAWNDVSKEISPEDAWTVKNGVLQPGGRRGTWLMSEKEYGDFILELEIKLTDVGNSGIALRAPMKGDPAFDGLELQVADFRYNPQAKADESTGALYRGIAPKKQVYKPVTWNAVRVELRGNRLKVVLNDEIVQDADLSQLDASPKRHDGSDASPLKDRPRKGHLGFQHLSRYNEPVLLRNVRIKQLPAT